jgi:hypothetical protein
MDYQDQMDREPAIRLYPNGTTIEEVQRKRKKDPKAKRTALREAFDEAFELIGGVPRLVLEYDKNHLGYARLHARLQDQELHVSGEVIIRPALPPSALDEPLEYPKLEQLPSNVIELRPEKVEVHDHPEPLP